MVYLVYDLTGPMPSILIKPGYICIYMYIAKFLTPFFQVFKLNNMKDPAYFVLLDGRHETLYTIFVDVKKNICTELHL